MSKVEIGQSYWVEYGCHAYQVKVLAKGGDKCVVKHLADGLYKGEEMVMAERNFICTSDEAAIYQEEDKAMKGVWARLFATKKGDVK